MIWLWTKFLLNGQELRSTFERNREMIKKHPPSRSPGELYGDLLEDLDPASGLSSWIDIPLDSFSFTMICQDGQSTR
jgi:hypothetical protein